MKKIIYCTMILLGFCLITGCSGRAAADTSGFKVLDLKAIQNAHWSTWFPVYGRPKDNAINDMISDYLDDGRVSGPESIDLQYLIDRGYLIVIPRNPYTGQDIKQSEEYSPGDVYFHYDVHEGGMLKLHFSEGNYEFRTRMFAKGDAPSTKFETCNFV